MNKKIASKVITGFIIFMVMMLLSAALGLSFPEMSPWLRLGIAVTAALVWDRLTFGSWYMTWPDFVWWTDEYVNHLRSDGKPVSRWWCDLNEFYIGQCPTRFKDGWLMRRRERKAIQ